MLAYILASIVGLGSIAIYLAAFFFPEIHRKNDFIWSGVGLFYALMLWIFGPNLSGWLLLGHVASVALLLWFGWQTLSLRRQLTLKVQQTAVPSTQQVQATIQKQVGNLSFLRERLGQVQTSLSNVLSGWQNRFRRQDGSKQAAFDKATVEETASNAVTEPAAAEIVDTEQSSEAITSGTPIAASPPVEQVEQAAAEAEALEQQLEQVPASESVSHTEVTPLTETNSDRASPKEQAG
jgi:hypothetical protein